MNPSSRELTFFEVIPNQENQVVSGSKEQESSSHSVNFVYSRASLLSGSAFGDCQTATDPTCSGGAAAVAAYARKYQGESDLGTLIVPRLDYESAFVQMHPLTWAVNRLVLKHWFGWNVFVAFPSLLSQHKEDDVAVSSRDLSDLQAYDVQALISNVAVPPTNSWSQYVQNIHFHHETGLAVIAIDQENQPFNTPQLESAMGLLAFVHQQNQRSGCAAPDTAASPFEVYASKNNVTLKEKQPCWITIVIFTPNTSEDDFLSFVQGLANQDYPPDVIIDVSANSPLFQHPTQLHASKTWVVSQQYRSSSFIQQQLVLSQDHTQVLNVTLLKEDISTIDPTIAAHDDQFAQDIDYIASLAKEAAANDPVVGSSDAMPLTRDPPYMPCMAGECPMGNLFMDALRWKAKADISFVNSGGVRGPGWPAGNVSVSDIWHSLPFANTRCEATMSGLSVFRLFNYSTSMATFQSYFVPNGDRLFQVSGVRVTYNPQLQSSRLLLIEVWNDKTQQFEPLERLRLYKVATTSWECTGFYPVPEYVGASKLVMAGEVPAQLFQEDLIQNIVGEYLSIQNKPYNTTVQGRLVNDTTSQEFMDWVQTAETCPPNTYWVENHLTCYDCPSSETVQFTTQTLLLEGTSGSLEDTLIEATVVNGAEFPIQLLPKKTPSWITWQVDAGNYVDTTSLEPGEQHTFAFLASALELDSGTAQATVSFAVQDGGFFPGCSGADASFDVVMEVAPPPELNKPEGIQIVGYILLTIVCLTALGFGSWVYCHRSKRTVQAHQPVFLINLCAGAIVLAFSILPWSLVDELESWSSRNMACMSLPWLLTVGSNMILCSLFAKLWRVNKIFHHSARHERVQVTLRDAFLSIGWLFCCNLVVLVIWSVVDPLKWEILHVPGEEWNRYGSCTHLNQAGRILFGLNASLNLLALCLATCQAFGARKISDDYSESRNLGFAVFAILQIGIVGGPIYFLISKDNPDARYLLFTLIIFGICMSGLLLIFVPVVRQYFQSVEDRDKGIRPSGVGMSMGRTQISGLSLGPGASVSGVANRSAASMSTLDNPPSSFMWK